MYHVLISEENALMRRLNIICACAHGYSCDTWLLSVRGAIFLHNQAAAAFRIFSACPTPIATLNTRLPKCSWLIHVHRTVTFDVRYELGSVKVQVGLQ